MSNEVESFFLQIQELNKPARFFEYKEVLIFDQTLLRHANLLGTLDLDPDEGWLAGLRYQYFC